MAGITKVEVLLRFIVGLPIAILGMVCRLIVDAFMAGFEKPTGETAETDIWGYLRKDQCPSRTKTAAVKPVN